MNLQAIVSSVFFFFVRLVAITNFGVRVRPSVSNLSLQRLRNLCYRQHYDTFCLLLLPSSPAHMKQSCPVRKFDCASPICTFFSCDCWSITIFKTFVFLHQVVLFHSKAYSSRWPSTRFRLSFQQNGSFFFTLSLPPSISSYSNSFNVSSSFAYSVLLYFAPMQYSCTQRRMSIYFQQVFLTQGASLSCSKSFLPSSYNIPSTFHLPFCWT